MTENRYGLYKNRGLTSIELIEIEHLAEICNKHERLDLKLNWGCLHRRPQNEINDFLYYENGQMVGFLPLFCFNSQEAEISGMVHPDYRRRGIFTALFNAAREECQHRSVPDILLIVEHISHAGQAFAKALDVRYDHSEYKMALEEVRLPSSFDEHLHFRRATTEDIQVLKHITAISFGMPDQEVNWYVSNMMDNSTRHYYVAALDDVYIGKIDVSFEAHEAFIYGFGVLPEYRGRGYGRQILARTVQNIVAAGRHHITLEVMTENKNALSLYQSCGFRETGSYDYYRFDVGKS